MTNFYQADRHQDPDRRDYSRGNLSGPLIKFFASQHITPVQQFITRCKYLASGVFLVLAFILFFYGLWGIAIKDNVLPLFAEDETTVVQVADEQSNPRKANSSEAEVKTIYSEPIQDAQIEKIKIALSVTFWSWLTLTVIFLCLLVINRRIMKSWLNSF